MSIGGTKQLPGGAMYKCKYFLMLSVALLFMGSVSSLSADGWRRGHADRDKHHFGKRHGHHGMRPFLQAWQTLTHPVGAFAQGKVEAQEDGSYQVTMQGDGVAVNAIFGMAPTAKDITGVSMRYEGFQLDRPRAAYSVLFVKDRTMAGFSEDPAQAWVQLMARYSNLGKNVQVTPVETGRVLKPDPATNGLYDRQASYQITGQKNHRSIDVVERVIMGDKWMVVATVAGKDVSNNGSKFLENIKISKSDEKAAYVLLTEEEDAEAVDDTSAEGGGVKEEEVEVSNGLVPLGFEFDKE